MKKIILSFIFAISVFSLQAQSNQDAKSIVKKAEESIRGNSLIATYAVTVKTAKWTREMEMKTWDDRLNKRSFNEIVAPRKDAGNRFLLINKNMTQVVPKLQQEIKISPSMMLQAWMGSDFTNDDIVKESSVIEDYNHTITGREKIDGEECHKIQLMPKKEAAVVWGKIIYFARVKDSLPARQEYYNEHQVLKKVLNYSNYKQIGDRFIPTLYKMKTSGKEDEKYTLLELKKAIFNTNIANNIFTLQNLKRK